MFTEWEISFVEYLDRIQINQQRFEACLNFPKINSLKKIIPLKNLTEVKAVIPLKKKFFEQTIRNITTLDKKEKPFKSSEINLIKVYPNQLKIGQKFVYRENYQKLIEQMPAIFDDYLICSGVCDLGAFALTGLDAEGNHCLAYYLPPIIERHYKKGPVIMDGIHRNFINRQIGHTLNAIIIDKVKTPFPCSFHSWDEIEIISLKNKPKNIKERYFDINPDLFRDLKYLGIDG